jgi:mono/diheme cytochrome c family protein
MNGLVRLILMLMMILTLATCWKAPTTTQSSVARGKYLVVLAGCNDCHTPKIPGPNGAPVPDNSKLLAGHLEKTPVPSWSPEDAKDKGVVAATNGSLTAWAGVRGA